MSSPLSETILSILAEPGFVEDVYTKWREIKLTQRSTIPHFHELDAAAAKPVQLIQYQVLSCLARLGPERLQQLRVSGKLTEHDERCFREMVHRTWMESQSHSRLGNDDAPVRPTEMLLAAMENEMAENEALIFDMHLAIVERLSARVYENLMLAAEEFSTAAEVFSEWLFETS